ncbi:Convertase P-domain protein [Aphelenchoides besseyi]|nr:Convertase P-domain protein [Aphelenchoides besseyi]
MTKTKWLAGGPVQLLSLLLVAFTLLDRLAAERFGSENEPQAEASHTILKLAKRDDELARRIARDHNMVVKGKPFMDSHYFVQHDDQTQPHRHKRSTLMRLENHPDVEWVREDAPRKRTKRDYVEEPTNDRSKRQVRNSLPVPKLPFPDPLYPDQWYLVGRAVGGFDMNVREAWNMGYAGRNVSISILDDGIQRDHPDLAQNYYALASTDINDHDDDPTPQNNGDNKHGTRCAGEVAAVAGNNVCGVGVAYFARIGGVRMLDGPVSDSVEAASLTLHPNAIDIFSASWGPEDDGKTFDGPGNLAQEAFYRGIKEGRNGKGNIFVWASGNGGSRQDSCSADGYTTSIYTLSISSATFDNRRPWYLEECPSTIATTYSSANINQPAVVTVDVPSGCTKMHTGTSASAPLAAGIIALALEANPSLTWRDMQHLVLRTSNPTPLLNNAGWSTNGVGRRVSSKFGYGLMDAGALVRLAREWKTVPEQHMCTYEYQLERPNPRPIVGRFKMNFSLDVTGCTDRGPVLYLEHVQVVATIRYAKRGDLKLTLYSPSGTEVVLLPSRPQDFNQNGFHKWPFLSVHTWGEDPRGTWTLVIESVTNNPSISGMISDWSLLLYGTAEPAQPSDPRYNPNQLPAKFIANSHSQQVHQSLTSQVFSSKWAFTGIQALVILAVLGIGGLTCYRMFASDVQRAVMSRQEGDLASTTVTSTSSLQEKDDGTIENAETGHSVVYTVPPPSIDVTHKTPGTALYGDVKSVGNCHSECEGCSEPGSAAACFACKHYTQALRNRAGFKCVSRCEDGFYPDGDKCKKCGSNCRTCSEAERCETCQGALFLIETHTQRVDQRHCVTACPLGLQADCKILSSKQKKRKRVADHHANQARCLIKKDICEDGFYLGVGARCQPCDEACRTCHGPGPLECLTCAQGYGNGTLGYCRPCCTGKDTPISTSHRCEDCGQLPKTNESNSELGSFVREFIFIVLFVIAVAFCYLEVGRRFCTSKESGLEYTPLKNNDLKDTFWSGDDTDDETEERNDIQSSIL